MYAAVTEHNWPCALAFAKTHSLSLVHHSIIDPCQLFMAHPLHTEFHVHAAVADLAFFERALAFAEKHDLLLVHDNPYVGTVMMRLQQLCTTLNSVRHIGLQTLHGSVGDIECFLSFT